MKADVRPRDRCEGSPRFRGDRPDRSDLARRHVAYGVQPEHYALVGSALLWTLEQGLGDEFTPALARHGQRLIAPYRR